MLTVGKVNTMGNELKPCPKCKSKNARFSEWWSSMVSAEVYCEDCDFRVHATGQKTADVEVKKLWNSITDWREFEREYALKFYKIYKDRAKEYLEDAIKLGHVPIETRAPEWQDISTAPREQLIFVVDSNNDRNIAYWYKSEPFPFIAYEEDGEFMEVDEAVNHCGCCAPEYEKNQITTAKGWMPLPTPPQKGE